ncbi:MAG: CBS domain-containing protein [Candidatus Micrarchaeota archaeon]
MEIKRTLVLDSSDSLSKALPQLDLTPAVIVTKNGRYCGVIDHRSISQGIRDPSSVKCETAIIRPPVLRESADVFQRMEAFLLGHFKALPVLGEDEAPLGITTRVELLQDMLQANLVPRMQVEELMSSPVFSIGEDDTIATAKRVMREKNTRRLAIVRGEILVGVISTYDMEALAARPNLVSGGRKDIRLPQQISVDDMKMSSFLRPDVTRIEEGTSLEQAVKRMVQKQVSMVIVMKDRKPLGVISALDVFKKVQELTHETVPVAISGLGEENIGHHVHIKQKIGRVVEKFGRTFNIRNVSVHVKENKSTFTVNIYLDVDKGHVSLKGERGSLKETVDELAVELGKVLRKTKEKRKAKPRATHAR